jgi:alkanesulfonate monooxygenase SsuD/methylene tetrahydromethanopterin reductase-like flavin-dependent oxidoreductase (luciferase family)
MCLTRDQHGRAEETGITPDLEAWPGRASTGWGYGRVSERDRECRRTPMATVHIGLTYPDLMAHITPGDLAERAERWGFHTFWVTDHALKPRLDPLVLLAAVSQRTHRLRLGTGVLAVPYRTPYLTAKAAASVDVLSGGRVTLGLGIGDLFPEFAALELDRRVRGRRLLTEERVSFTGRFHRVTDLQLLPRPVQQPHIPLWVGGHWDGGFVAPVLRRVARFADVFFPTWTPVEGYRAAQAAIRRHARVQGRDPNAIGWGVQIWTCVGDNTAQGRRTGIQALQERFGLAQVDVAQSTAMGSAADCIATLERYVALGITEFNLSAVCPAPEMAEQYGRIAVEILPHFAR